MPATIQPGPPTLSLQLRDRLRRLGVTVLCVSSTGRAVPQDGCRWVEQLLLNSPQFTVALRRRWAVLTQRHGQVVEVWPGVTLVSLPAQRRRRPALHEEQPQVLAALLLGPELIASDQLRGVCDANGVDHRTTLSRIEPASLLGPEEARRLAHVVMWMHEDASEIDRRHTELQMMSQELSESYEELSLLYKLSSNMTVDQRPEAFLVDACRELREVVGLRWMALQLIDEPRLKSLRHGVFHAGTFDRGTSALGELGMQLIARLNLDPQPMIIDDTAAATAADRPAGALTCAMCHSLIIDDTATLNIPGLEALASTLLIIPIRSESQLLGVLFGGDKLNGEHISSVDSKLCSSLANSLAIFLENRMLYDDMQAMFLGTLHALTSAIDAKDSYTHGHSERVALMSRMLARAAGLDAGTCERIYIAGLVHDVGKIGVPEQVLCKPGRLTEEEFALIKMHPQIGARILQDIRQMQDLVPGVLHHHERWDGSGYPYNLAGEQIPQFGRVIGLADAFDAMSSDRTYRSAMGHEDVLAEVRRCSGKQFDPQLVEVFVRLDFAPYFALIRRHQRRQIRQSA